MFIRGETVFVSYDGGISNIYGDELPSFNFEFKISERDPKNFYSRSIKEILVCENENNESYTKIEPLQKVTEINDELPEDFPDITINVSNNPSPGYFFISPLLWSYPLGYLIIVDNDGIPIYYQRTPYSMFDFKRQDNGLLTFGDPITHYFYEMDSSFAIIDSFATGNGYNIDFHDFQILPAGHSLLMAYDFQIVRMDSIVPGGDSAATVIGLIIQELDASKMLYSNGGVGTTLRLRMQLKILT